MESTEENGEETVKSAAEPAASEPAAPEHAPAAPRHKAVEVREKRAEGAPQQHQKPSGDQMITRLIAESGNPEAVKLKEEIDALKKERIEAIIKVKIARKRLAYKEHELEDVKRAAEQNKTDTTEQRRQIGKMKRMKNSLEFRVSTEARSLNEERKLIKEIADVNAKLKELYKSIRFEKKLEFVEGDIKRYTEEVEEATKKIAEADSKLDEKYNALRKMLGIERGRRREPGERYERREPRERKPQFKEQQEAINFEDIAVIKKKKSA